MVYKENMKISRGQDVDLCCYCRQLGVHPLGSLLVDLRRLFARLPARLCPEDGDPGLGPVGGAGGPGAGYQGQPGPLSLVQDNRDFPLIGRDLHNDEIFSVCRYTSSLMP